MLDKSLLEYLNELFHLSVANGKYDEADKLLNLLVSEEHRPEVKHAN